VSFGWSLWEIRWTPVEAYYGTLARAWELAVGGLMAVLATARIALPRRAASALSWLGLATIVIAAFVIDEGTPFPGVAALAPVLGAAAVLFAGNAVGLPGACRPLGARLPREIGRLSYSIYLWHWPFLVLAPYAIGELDGMKTTAVVLVSVVVAWVTFHLVEDPVRHSRSLAASSTGSLLLGASLIAVGLLAGQVAARPALPGTTSQASTGPGSESSGAIVPDPARARFDVDRIREDRCQSLFDWTEVKECIYGDPAATQKWVLWGDSHAVQWFPALEANATEAGVALQVFGKTSCPASLVTIYSRKWDRVYTECTTWRDEVYRQVQAMPKGTVVFLSGMHEYVVVEDGQILDQAASAPPIAAGQQEIARTLTDLGMTVVTIRDTPFPEIDVPQCVSQNMDDPSSCDFPRPPSARGTSWEERTLSGIPGVRHVDLIDEVCDRRTCPAVVDNILRWRDRDHLTATFMDTLVQPMADQLNAIGL
jgi:hypothetical protein